MDCAVENCVFEGSGFNFRSSCDIFIANLFHLLATGLLVPQILTCQLTKILMERWAKNEIRTECSSVTARTNWLPPVLKKVQFNALINIKEVYFHMFGYVPTIVSMIFLVEFKN